MNVHLFPGALAPASSPPPHSTRAGQAAVVLQVMKDVPAAHSLLSESPCSGCYEPDQESTFPRSWENTVEYLWSQVRSDEGSLHLHPLLSLQIRCGSSTSAWDKLQTEMAIGIGRLLGDPARRQVTSGLGVLAFHERRLSIRGQEACVKSCPVPRSRASFPVPASAPLSLHISYLNSVTIVVSHLVLGANVSSWLGVTSSSRCLSG